MVPSADTDGNEQLTPSKLSIWSLRGVMGCMCVCPQNSYVETLTPSWMILGGRAFGRI